MCVCVQQRLNFISDDIFCRGWSNKRWRIRRKALHAIKAFNPENGTVRGLASNTEVLRKFKVQKLITKNSNVGEHYAENTEY